MVLFLGFTLLTTAFASCIRAKTTNTVTAAKTTAAMISFTSQIPLNWMDSLSAKKPFMILPFRQQKNYPDYLLYNNPPVYVKSHG